MEDGLVIGGALLAVLMWFFLTRMLVSIAIKVVLTIVALAVVLWAFGSAENVIGEAARMVFSALETGLAFLKDLF